MRLLPGVTLVLYSIGLFAQNPDSATKASAHWRPAYHFSPPKNWINDPNGLVYYAGEYHLFYQYNPYENKWGHMSWGHAVSRDLLRWEHLPVAIPEDSSRLDPVWIFSGCVVVDKTNTAGFGQDAFVAIYTADHHGQGEDQHLAYSTDQGRSWTKYAKNPVLGPRQKDFRDPNVIWHAPSKQWVMSVVKPTEYKVEFYGSKNLKTWTKLGDFGPAGDVRKIWECPALVEVPVQGGGKKWVLLLSGNGPHEGFVGMQYFVGNFDGKTFKAENKEPLYVDYGKDFYAAIPYHETPSGRPVIIGWMSSWQYAEALPTFPWKGQMSLPREISVRKTAEGWRLVQNPVPLLTKIRSTYHSFSNLWIGIQEVNLPTTTKWNGRRLEIIADVSVDNGTYFNIHLTKDSTQERTTVGFDAGKQQIYVDRTKSGKFFNSNFPSRDVASMQARNNRLTFHILLDNSSIEVFSNDGQTVLTSIIFPSIESQGLSFSSDGLGHIHTISVRELEF